MNFNRLASARLCLKQVHCFGKQQAESLPRPMGLKPETLNPKT